MMEVMEPDTYEVIVEIRRRGGKTGHSYHIGRTRVIGYGYATTDEAEEFAELFTEPGCERCGGEVFLVVECRECGHTQTGRDGEW